MARVAELTSACSRSRKLLARTRAKPSAMRRPTGSLGTWVVVYVVVAATASGLRPHAAFRRAVGNRTSFIP